MGVPDGGSRYGTTKSMFLPDLRSLPAACSRFRFRDGKWSTKHART